MPTLDSATWTAPGPRGRGRGVPAATKAVFRRERPQKQNQDTSAEEQPHGGGCGSLGGGGAAPPRGAPWERWAGPRGAFVPMASLEAAAVSSFCLPGPCGSRSQPPRLPAPPFVPSSRSPGPSRASAPLLLCSVQTLPCPWVPSLVLRLRQWTGAGPFNGPAPTSVQRDTDGRETGRGPGVTQ